MTPGVRIDSGSNETNTAGREWASGHETAIETAAGPTALYADCGPAWIEPTRIDVPNLERVEMAMTTTEQRGFSGIYDAKGHRADVIALLQGGMTEVELTFVRRLTDDEVAAIRADYRFGEVGHSLNALARRFGVDDRTIWNVVNGMTHRAVA